MDSLGLKNESESIKWDIEYLEEVKTKLVPILAGLDSHYSSSIAVLDILITLYCGEIIDHKDPENSDRLILSQGHIASALYTVLNQIGVCELSDIGIRGGLPTHAEPVVPGVDSFTGSLGGGIAVAIGIQEAKHRLNRSGFSYVIIGDGEYQCGAIQESLGLLAEKNFSDVITIINANGLSFSRYLSNDNLEAELTAKGFQVIIVDDGHNFSQLLAAFSQVRQRILNAEASRPFALIINTIKGKGTPLVGELQSHKYKTGKSLGLTNCEKPPSQSFRFSIAPFELTKPNLLSASDEHATREIGLTLEQLNRTNSNISVISPDTSQSTYIEQCPDLMEIGIRELTAPAVAYGLALEGIFPVIVSFDCFLDLMLERVKSFLWASGSPFLLISTHSGISIGSDGITHFGILPVQAMETLALEIYEPADLNEAIFSLHHILSKFSVRSIANLQFYLRTARLPIKGITDYSQPESATKLEKGAYIISGERSDSIAILTAGVCVSQAIKARLQLSSEKIKVINVPSFSNAARSGELRKLIKTGDRVFIFYDGPSTVFQKLLFLAEISAPGNRISITSFDLSENYPRSAAFHRCSDNVGDASDLLSRYEISSASIVSQISKDKK